MREKQRLDRSGGEGGGVTLSCDDVCMKELENNCGWSTMQAKTGRRGSEVSQTTPGLTEGRKFDSLGFSFQSSDTFVRPRVPHQRNYHGKRYLVTKKHCRINVTIDLHKDERRRR